MRQKFFMQRSRLTALLASLLLASSSADLAATATFTSLGNGRAVSGLQNGNPRSLGFA
jgi:hypothetical protein